MPLRLYKHQQELLDFNPKRHLISFGTGTGKTITAIMLANKNCRTVLVVCPKALAENWRRNMIEHAWPSLIWSVVTKEEFKKHWDHLMPYQGIIID